MGYFYGNGWKVNSGWRSTLPAGPSLFHRMEWTRTDQNVSLFHGMERTAQCTAELYSAMHSQNTIKSVMRLDNLQGHQHASNSSKDLLKKELPRSLPLVKPKVGKILSRKPGSRLACKTRKNSCTKKRWNWVRCSYYRFCKKHCFSIAIYRLFEVSNAG